MEQTTSSVSETPTSRHFKAETRQLLNILIHSLYTEKEIFLRELISNASDALTRLDYEMLVDRNVIDPDVPPSIRIEPDKDNQTLVITDTGVGMTADEMEQNLGTIAHSGARAFVQAFEEKKNSLSDIIGQFGVGFYSAFMVADQIKVISRSFRPDAQPALWTSDGTDIYTIEPCDRTERGTRIELKLKEDALEFLEPHKIKEVIHKHSDYVAYPIYVGAETDQVNQQTALWRQHPRQVEEKAYLDFYKHLTLDFEDPLARAHMVVDAPVQMYALLFIPASPEKNMFSLRKEDGLKLYSHKVLIQEYCKDLLPDYLGFVQGVVDSEDLPLNVSRESVQANKIMTNLKKLVTTKIVDTLKNIAKDDPEKYAQFWARYSRHIKQGIATETGEPDNLYSLLLFHTDQKPSEWSSLDDYLERMKEGQNEIYYVMGDDEKSVLYSPHLDILHKHGYEALLLTDPLDSFVIVRMSQYKDHKLINAASAELQLPEGAGPDGAEPKETNPETEEQLARLVESVKSRLGDKVSEVRLTDRLSEAPARLVDPQGVPNQEMQRVYRLINKEFEAPRKILELNRRHPIILSLVSMSPEDTLGVLVIDQLFENALLIEGLHPDPAGMIGRIQTIIEKALKP